MSDTMKTKHKAKIAISTKTLKNSRSGRAFLVGLYYGHRTRTILHNVLRGL